MSYLIFRNVSTDTLGDVYVQKMISHKKAALRTDEIYVDGRDGALHIVHGYSDFDVQATLILIDGAATARQIVNAWADGTGKLITSDDLTKAYKATVIGEVKWERVKAASLVEEFSATKQYLVRDLTKYQGQIYRFKTNHRGNWNSADVDPIYYVVNGLFDTAKITFNCQPFMCEAQDSVIEFVQDGTLTNPGSADALPLIKVEGSGNVQFDIAGEHIEIDSMAANDPVFIDSDAGYVYSGNGTARAMRGEFPTLPLGTCAVDLGTGISKLTITPHWRWI